VIRLDLPQKYVMPVTIFTSTKGKSVVFIENNVVTTKSSWLW